MRSVLSIWDYLARVPQLTLPTAQQRNVAKELVNLLTPFERASILLQVEKRPSASLVFPMVMYLWTHFEEVDLRTFFFTLLHYV